MDLDLGLNINWVIEGPQPVQVGSFRSKMACVCFPYIIFFFYVGTGPGYKLVFLIGVCLCHVCPSCVSYHCGPYSCHLALLPIKFSSKNHKHGSWRVHAGSISPYVKQVNKRVDASASEPACTSLKASRADKWIIPWLLSHQLLSQPMKLGQIAVLRRRQEVFGYLWLT